MRTLLAVMCLLLPAAPAAAQAIADPVENPARGTKSCLVLSPTSNVFASVEPDGTIGLAVEADTDPRSNIYFMIHEKRYAGPSSVFLSMPAEPLLDDPVIDFSYTDWPHGAEIIGETTIDGFAAAYRECVEFLQS